MRSSLLFAREFEQAVPLFVDPGLRFLDHPLVAGLEHVLEAALQTEKFLDRELLLPVLGVRESYLAAAFAQMREQFGDIEGYAREGLGLSAGDERRLRELFL